MGAVCHQYWSHPIAGSTPTKKYNADVMVSADHLEIRGLNDCVCLHAQSLEERVERNMQVIAKAEQKMAELQKEREQVFWLTIYVSYKW